MSDAKSGLQLRSLIKKSGELEISLVKVPTPEPGPDEVVVRVEATPINPSDLGLLIGPADMTTAKASGSKDCSGHHRESARQPALRAMAAGSTSPCRSATKAPARWSRPARRRRRRR